MKKQILIGIFTVMVLMIFIFPLTQATAIFQITSPPSFSSTLGEPGETIGVTFTIKNIGTTSGDYYVEAGIAPKGWNGYSFYPDFLYSIFKEGKCCSGNEFYDGGTVTLAAGARYHNRAPAFPYGPRVAS